MELQLVDFQILKIIYVDIALQIHFNFLRVISVCIQIESIERNFQVVVSENASQRVGECQVFNNFAKFITIHVRIWHKEDLHLDIIHRFRLKLVYKIIVFQLLWRDTLIMSCSE
jgi:hypothetical protein